MIVRQAPNKGIGYRMNKLMICSICVRGGSKGVVGKNIRPIQGKPLLAHSIAQAKDSDLFECVVVSSDDQGILDIAISFGADEVVLRPPELATDTAAKPPVIRHCIETIIKRRNIQYDTIVDLDATSPLRNVDDIRAAVGLLQKSGCGNVITGTPSHRSPYFNMVEETDQGTVKLCRNLDNKIVRRQDAPNCYDMNASIYVWSQKAFMEGPQVFGSDTKIYVMPAERSIDIDSELDWDIVEMLMSKRSDI